MTKEQESLSSKLIRTRCTGCGGVSQPYGDDNYKCLVYGDNEELVLRVYEDEKGRCRHRFFKNGDSGEQFFELLHEKIEAVESSF